MTIAGINGGKEYVENHTYSDKIVCAYWTDERYTVAENLTKRMPRKNSIRWLVQYRTYECDVLDLAKLRPEYSFLNFSVHQSVLLIDRQRGTRMVHKVMEYYQYPFDPTQNRVVLSNAGTTLQDVLGSITDKIEEVEKQTGKYIKELIDTDEEFKRKFIKVDESFSEVRQTAEELSMRVTNEVNNLSAQIKINADAIETKVTARDFFDYSPVRR